MRLPLVVATILLAIIAAGAPPAVATTSDSQDLGVLHLAAAHLGHETPSMVTHWLRLQRSVRWAQVGRDGRTVDIRFRDGQGMLVLPAGLSRVRVPALRRGPHPLARAQQTVGSKAAVLEPFATELGLGSSAGAPEANDLQQAGFQVDNVYNGSVTVSFMTSLPSYNVVYMHTHSGVSAGGDGVLATGQLANNDASVAAYLQDGSVVKVGVAGDNLNAYYALTSRFFATHVSPFAQDSILFLNGCKLLPATTFLNTLAVRGAGVVISWTDDATTQDDYLSAATLFNFMGQGQSVAGAIQSTQAAGYGTSNYQGVTATLGYRGDGTITLSRAAHGQGAAPTPIPTATRVPTSGPQPTATSVPPGVTPIAPTATAIPPTATATQVPVTLTGMLAAVAPGKKQTVGVRAAADSRLDLLVTMPNGLQISKPFVADSAGSGSVSFVQPGNSILRNSSTATLTVRSGNGPTNREVTGTYTIEFGKIDLAIDRHATLKIGKRIAVWVHTRAHTPVHLAVKAPKHAAVKAHGKTDAHGWVKLHYSVPRGLAGGGRIRFTATARAGGKSFRTTTSAPVV